MAANYYMAGVGPFSIVDGTAVTGAATLTEASPLPQIQIPANFLDFAGKRLEFQAYGHYTTNATATTVTFGLYSGTIAQAIGSAAVLCVSAAVTMVASQTNRTWRVEGNMQVRAVGSSGNCIAVAEGSNWTSGGTDMASTAAGSTVTIDTTVARYFALAVNQSNAQSITCRYFGVRSVN